MPPKRLQPSTGDETSRRTKPRVHDSSSPRVDETAVPDETAAEAPVTELVAELAVALMKKGANEPGSSYVEE